MLGKLGRVEFPVLVGLLVGAGAMATLVNLDVVLLAIQVWSGLLYHSFHMTAIDKLYFFAGPTNLTGAHHL